MELAEQALEQGPCWCLGELIHNTAVVERLAGAGMRTVESPEEVPAGGRVIIRSHGVGKATVAALEAGGAVILDATCPKVSHIHRLVEDAEARGRLPVVIGDDGHPEVRAIRGWCGESLAFAGAEDFAAWLDESAKNREKPLSLVFQTTQTQKNLSRCKNLIKNRCTNCELFDTICGATFIRQQEAAELARQCDGMVVIGGGTVPIACTWQNSAGDLCPGVFRGVCGRAVRC